MIFSSDHGAAVRRLEVLLPSGSVLKPGLATVDVLVPARGEWRGCFEFRLEEDSERIEVRFRCGEPIEHTTPIVRLRSWEQAAPRVSSGHDGMNTAIEQSVRDLGALRIFDPDDPGRAVIAAGAPWFMTLFVRDSLLTSLMTLSVDPTLAVGTLRTLACLQGAKVDPSSEEQPGKILHELRHALGSAADSKQGSVYYGSIDATPLFVVLLGELGRWGFGDAVQELLRHADRALRWIEEFGDRDGDGFVEYERSTQRGLVNQGWKDSFDGVNFADGRIAEAPIALCEVQGYVYAAYVARAEIARGFGDDATAFDCTARAAKLKQAFNDQFWPSDRGYFALGLDGNKRPIDSLTSNIGHCLWAGIVDDDKARRVADHLIGREMFTGWGIRTLGTSMGAYNPVSYHNGSVWAHDSAICAAGLMRYGFVDEAHAVTLGLLRAAGSFAGRLPELLCGFDSSDFATPVRYPTSCAPQAWSSAAVLFLLRTVLLRLDVYAQEGLLWLAPCLPPEIGPISISGLAVAGARLSIETDGVHTKVDGLPTGLQLVKAKRPIFVP